MEHFVDLGDGCVINIKAIAYILKGGDSRDPDMYEVAFTTRSAGLLLDEEDYERLTAYMQSLNDVTLKTAAILAGMKPIL